MSNWTLPVGIIAILAGFYLIRKAYSNEIEAIQGDLVFACYVLGGLFLSSIGFALILAVGFA